MMKVIAKKIVIEQTENDIEKLEIIYEVKAGETVEQLMKRVGLYGDFEWHFKEAEVVLKLVKE